MKISERKVAAVRRFPPENHLALCAQFPLLCALCRPDGHDHSVRLHLDRQRPFRRRGLCRRHAAGAEEEIPDRRRRRGLYRGVFDGAGAVAQADMKKRNPRCDGGSVFASGWEYMSAGVRTRSL